MRRLIAFWAMCLLSLMVISVFIGSSIAPQIFVIVGSIVTVSIGASAIKNPQIKK